MDPRIALAQEYDALAEITDQYAEGVTLATHLWQQEARVHRALAAVYRHEAGSDPLLRAVRALAGLDPDALKSITPEAMHRVLGRRGWTKTGEIPWAGDPSRVAFHTYDHPTAQGGDRGGVVPAVLVPQGPDAHDYPRRVMEWTTGVAARHGDVAPAEVLAEAWEKP
jgi:hypothetical protein